MVQGWIWPILFSLPQANTNPWSPVFHSSEAKAGGVQWCHGDDAAEEVVVLVVVAVHIGDVHDWVDEILGKVSPTLFGQGQQRLDAGHIVVESGNGQGREISQLASPVFGPSRLSTSTTVKHFNVVASRHRVVVCEPASPSPINAGCW